MIGGQDGIIKELSLEIYHLITVAEDMKMKISAKKIGA
jgi:hypothetical protein